jgi:hypothetical protein
MGRAFSLLSASFPFLSDITSGQYVIYRVASPARCFRELAKKGKFVEEA